MVKAATTRLGSFVALWAEDLAAAILGLPDSLRVKLESEGVALGGAQQHR